MKGRWVSGECNFHSKKHIDLGWCKIPSHLLRDTFSLLNEKFWTNTYIQKMERQTRKNDTSSSFKLIFFCERPMINVNIIPTLSIRIRSTLTIIQPRHIDATWIYSPARMQVAYEGLWGFATKHETESWWWLLLGYDLSFKKMPWLDKTTLSAKDLPQSSR